MACKFNEAPLTTDTYACRETFTIFYNTSVIISNKKKSELITVIRASAARYLLFNEMFVVVTKLFRRIINKHNYIVYIMSIRTTHRC